MRFKSSRAKLQYLTNMGFFRVILFDIHLLPIQSMEFLGDGDPEGFSYEFYIFANCSFKAVSPFLHEVLCVNSRKVKREIILLT